MKTLNLKLTNEEGEKLTGLLKKMIEEMGAKEMGLEETVCDYIEKHGIPATEAHDQLLGDECDEYIENHGLDFEDIRTIIED